MRAAGVRPRSVLFAAALVIAALTVACGTDQRGPTAPSSSSIADVSPDLTPNGFGQLTTSGVADLATCLRAPSPPCVSFASVLRPQRISARAVGTPLNLTSSVVGTAVTLTWTAPGGQTSYVIEAGSSSGLANLAVLQTGNALTTFTANGVPAGTYYVRVRALDASLTAGPASNEVVVVVTGGACVPPGAPPNVSITQNSGGTVTLSWTAASGAPTSYVLEAGSAPGQANLANTDVGSITSFTATGVAAGSYYVRVRGRNACGIGPVSIEVTVVVTTVISGGGNRSMTARIDGVPWTALPGFIQVTRTGPTLGNPAGTIGLTGNDTFMCPIRAITFGVPRAVGTYAIGPVPLGTPLNIATAALSSLNCRLGQWFADAFNGSGSITLSTVTSNSASGTFTFTAEPQRGSGATGNKVISDGVFNVTF